MQRDDWYTKHHIFMAALTQSSYAAPIQILACCRTFRVKFQHLRVKIWVTVHMCICVYIYIHCMVIWTRKATIISVKNWYFCLWLIMHAIWWRQTEAQSRNSVLPAAPVRKWKWSSQLGSLRTHITVKPTYYGTSGTQKPIIGVANSLLPRIYKS